ncbi:heme o synthase [Sporosarcina sp. CAU 1771]
MTKEMITSGQLVKKPMLTTEQDKPSLLTDLIYLFKGPVLISNVLPVLTGFWLALYFTGTSISENLVVFLLTIIGSTFVMAGALLLNNWYEVDLDKEMARTKNRPTVTGTISLQKVLAMGIILSVLGIILLLFTTIEATIYAFIGWFTYVILYTMWSKRKYTLNTVVGSISGAVTPLIGWTAIAPGYHYVPIVLALIIFIWQMPHTFAIAIKRQDEYKAAGVAMLPVVRGIAFTKRQIVIYVACLFPLPFFLGSLGTVFLVVAALLNIGFLIAGISGFFTKNDYKWSQMMFLFSVNYLAILFIMMIVITLPFFN